MERSLRVNYESVLNGLCFIFQGILGLSHIPRDFPEMVYETFKKIPETKYAKLLNMNHEPVVE